MVCCPRKGGGGTSFQLAIRNGRGEGKKMPEWEGKRNGVGEVNCHNNAKGVQKKGGRETMLFLVAFHHAMEGFFAGA